MKERISCVDFKFKPKGRYKRREKLNIMHYFESAYNNPGSNEYVIVIDPEAKQLIQPAGLAE